MHTYEYQNRLLAQKKRISGDIVDGVLQKKLTELCSGTCTAYHKQEKCAVDIELKQKYSSSQFSL